MGHPPRARAPSPDADSGSEGPGGDEALSIRDAVDRLVEEHFPGAEVLELYRFGTDEAPDDLTAKAAGYGKPIRVRLREPSGDVRTVVLHTATANPFGHDRRADRAAEMILAYDTFRLIPRHVPALDVGAIANDGSLRSLRQTGEFYVLTSFAEGKVYAEDLRRLARDGRATDRDLARVEALGRYLVELHDATLELPSRDGEIAYARAIRDLLGSGEGIFGIVDGYPTDVPGASSRRLKRLEERCLDWRWRLRRQSERLVRTHGDFHPFNVLFDDEDELALLDASRGCLGDPADDLTAMAINFVFFALPEPSSWRDGFAHLWRRFWEVYLEARGEPVLAAAPPFLAWRALVVANPAWYPDIAPEVRDAILTLAERSLDSEAFDPGIAEELFP
jgi:hypothetical protein